jgi:heavy metal sensor kinase
MFDSVRMRLTLWYVGVLSLILVSFSIAVYVFVERSLYDRMDAGLRSTIETVSAALERQAAAGETSREALENGLQQLRFPSHAIAILDAQGRLLAQKPVAANMPVRMPPFGTESVVSPRFYSLEERIPDTDDSCRGVVQRIQIPSQNISFLVVVNQSLELLTDDLELLQDILYVAVPLSLVLAGFGGWFLARRSLAPVVAMSEQARRISAQNLDQRLPIANPRDELGRLAATLNELLARLSNSFVQQRQFMADASHELRTPLSAIRTASAVTLQQEDRERSEYREALTIVEQQARRLSRIVEDMFVLARADAGPPALQSTEFYLDELVAETARAAALLAGQKNLQLQVAPLPETLFRGDEGLLRQMLWNLLDNAIKHTPEGGRVRIALESRDRECVITVTDTGIGIPPEAQPHIFERFYRADPARSRAESANEGGSGLGLPIARWIAEAHHGGLELQCSAETGSTFAAVLPRL